MILFLHELGIACGAGQMFYTGKKKHFFNNKRKQKVNFTNYKKAWSLSQFTLGRKGICIKYPRCRIDRSTLYLQG